MATNSQIFNRNIRPFGGQNYDAWSFRVKMLLQREKVLKVVTDPIPLSSRQSPEWTDNNGIAMEIITANVADRYLNVTNRYTVLMPKVCGMQSRRISDSVPI